MTPIKPGWLDWIVYRLFRWRWNVILATNPQMLKLVVEYIDAWRQVHKEPSWEDTP